VFSGDKLLGGPQAGAVVGRPDLVERCRRDPLARALRLDKLRMAALEATLSSHRREALEELPTFALAQADVARLRERAEQLAAGCGGTVVEVEAVFGGGSAPDARLPSVGVALPGDAEAVAAGCAPATRPWSLGSSTTGWSPTCARCPPTSTRPWAPASPAPSMR
jgi:L-seryl-tRNA(Ser) seleniumtransferase